MSVSNGFSLVGCAVQLVAPSPQSALGLAQLGQEEIGKSLSILAAIGMRDTHENWQTFWSNWKNHKLKAYRAFLYEIFSPLRVETQTPMGERLAGASKRQTIHHEKEAAFYVNFDPERGCFVQPNDNVESAEVYNRVMTAMYLSVKAQAVLRAIHAEDTAFRYEAVSELARRITTEDLFQQDRPVLFIEMKSRSKQHLACIEALGAAFNDEANFWAESKAGLPGSATSPPATDA